MPLFNTCKHSTAELADLREGLKTLEKSFKAIELEWMETYDKMRHMMGRISKRADIMAKAAEAVEEAQPDDVDGAPMLPTEPLALTARQNKINELILRSRARH